jgi:hypothetical protein
MKFPELKRNYVKKSSFFFFFWGVKPGLVVRAEDSRPRGRGFESCHILDGCERFASYYIKEKLKIKVAKWGTPKKYLKKKNLF